MEPDAELAIPGVDVPPVGSQPSQLRAGFRDPAMLPAIRACPSHAFNVCRHWRRTNASANARESISPSCRLCFAGSRPLPTQPHAKPYGSAHIASFRHTNTRAKLPSRIRRACGQSLCFQESRPTRCSVCFLLSRSVSLCLCMYAYIILHIHLSLCTVCICPFICGEP